MDQHELNHRGMVFLHLLSFTFAYLRSPEHVHLLWINIGDYPTFVYVCED